MQLSIALKQAHRQYRVIQGKIGRMVLHRLSDTEPAHSQKEGQHATCPAVLFASCCTCAC